MRFSVAPAGTRHADLSAPKPGTTVAPLSRFRRDYTSPRVYEVVEGVTEDETTGQDEWLYLRAADGTWSTSHVPTGTVVKAGLRSLGACRRYAGTGRAQADLEQIQAQTETRERKAS